MAIYDVFLIYAEGSTNSEGCSFQRRLIATTNDIESHKKEAHYQLDEMFKELEKWKEAKAVEDAGLPQTA